MNTPNHLLRRNVNLTILAAAWLGLGVGLVHAQPTSYNDFQIGASRGLNVDFPWGGQNNAFWTRSADGSDPLTAWPQGDNAALGVPAGPSGFFTATLDSSPILVGALTVTSGTWTVAVGNNTFSLGASSTATSANFSLAGGSLSLAGSDMTASLGTLAHSGGALNFGTSGANILSFSGAAGTWSSTLSILNYSAASGDALRFGSSGNALDSTQLSSISFNGVAAQIDASGFVTPVPEPAAYATMLGAAACGAAGWSRFRRRRGH